jgi:hypothetical protein
VPFLALGDEGVCSNWSYEEQSSSLETAYTSSTKNTDKRSSVDTDANIFSTMLSVLTFPVTMWIPSSKRSSSSEKPSINSLKTNNPSSNVLTNAHHFTDTATTSSVVSPVRMPMDGRAEAYARRYLSFGSGLVVGKDKIFKFAKRVPNHPAM